MITKAAVSDMWLVGDARERLAGLEDASMHCCVTSPPYYGLRDYGETAQIGQEATPDAYVAALVEVFRGVRRVLRDDGTVWLNLGDSYCASPPGNKTLGVSDKSTLHGVNGLSEAYRATLAAGHATKMDTSKIQGLKPKDLIGIPWMVAFALRADGWYLRADIIWSKPNPMPESVTDRPTKAHEYVFLLSKSATYYYDAEAIKEPANPDNYRANATSRITPPGQTQQGRLDAHRGEVLCDTRNRRSVWTIATKPFAGAHFATMPPNLVEPCILAGSPVDGVVLDPFGGAGTVPLVARLTGRRFVYIDVNADYAKMARARVEGETWQPALFGAAK